MSLKEINDLERKGQLKEAYEKNLLMLKESVDEGFLRIANLNAQRLLQKINKNGGIEKSDKKSLPQSGGQKADAGAGVLKNNAPPAGISKNPLVTVVVPCFNSEKYLERTLDSIICQTYGNYEVMVIDDYSTDCTVRIIKDYVKKSKRIRFYQHRSNGGLSSARNSGIRLARGEYVCFLDSDDILSKESLKNRVNLLNVYSDCDFVAGVYDQSITVEDDFSGVIEDTNQKPMNDYADFINVQGDCPFNANQPMIKRSVLVDSGGFPENYPQAEDWRLWSKIMRAGLVFIPVNKVGSGYRQTPGSMIRRAPLLHLEKSYGNYFRSHKKNSEEVDSVELKYESNFRLGSFFNDSAGYYEGLRKFLPRVINFAGIEYGRRIGEEDFSVDYLSEKIGAIFPELSISMTGYTVDAMFGWFSNGVKRYRGVTRLGEDEAINAREFLLKLLRKCHSSDKGVHIGSANLMIPFRELKYNSSQYIDVLFFPHKKYHTDSFKLLRSVLETKGITSKLVDISVPYRDEGARIRELEDSFISYNEFVFSRFVPRVIVCMNDWDTVVKPLVKKANTFNIPTIGIVEGVQDYHDVDTGRKRYPYTEVKNVFLTGDFDKKYFSNPDQNLFSIGVQRLEGLGVYASRRQNSSRNARKIAVLNVNFSYGVMTDRRYKWVKDVAEACKKQGYKLLISQHPQDDGDLSEFQVDSRPLYDLLVEAEVFISRFSGAILESLVIGCPVIYYNGHGEKIDKFYDSMGAYQVANTDDELNQALRVVGEKDADAGPFLKAHGGYGLEGSIVERSASCIEKILRDSNTTEDAMMAFKNSLLT